MVWGILAADLDDAQQCAAIVNQLGGDAAVMALNCAYDDLTNGAMVNGVHLGPVTYLLTQLAAAYAPLGEEVRLKAMSDLMMFQRLNGENTDALVARFRQLRYLAAQGGAGINMSWEGYCWLLIRAVGVTSNQLLTVLQPFQGRFPNTEQEFEEMIMTMRRMGHILEGSVGNLAQQLRTPPSGATAASLFPTWGNHTQQPVPATLMQHAFPSYTPPPPVQSWAPTDPWSAQDPWQSQQQQAGQATASRAQPASAAHSAYPAAQGGDNFVYDSGTDSDTISSINDVVHENPTVVALAPVIKKSITSGTARRRNPTGEDI